MGSGKSSWCRQWVSKHNKSIWISRDAIRYSILAPGEEYFSREQEVLKEFRRQAQNAIDNEEINYVLLDASHLSDKSIAKTLKNLNISKDVRVVNVRLTTPLEVCLERNALREGRERVPDEVIKNAYSIFLNSGKIDWVRRRINDTWEVSI
jgi:predicted kinase